MDSFEDIRNIIVSERESRLPIYSSLFGSIVGEGVRTSVSRIQAAREAEKAHDRMIRAINNFQ